MKASTSTPLMHLHPWSRHSETTFQRCRSHAKLSRTQLFFNRMFDGVVAWGLIFLLPAEEQRRLIQRVARHIGAWWPAVVHIAG